MDANYIGDELELFAHAKRWKHYWGTQIAPFIGTYVLEVGAGIGTNMNYLLAQNSHVKQWVCLEPDVRLANQIATGLDAKLNSKVQIEKGYLKDYKTATKFDTILYIDVIEHLEDDVSEIELAKSMLSTNGHLIILVPAHNYLFSDFDKAIGHFRRYDKKMLKNAVGNDLKQEQLMYLDSIGMFASMMNKLFLKQSYPTLKQIKFWDNYIIPISQISDGIFMYSVGKTLVGIWTKQ